MRKKTVKENPIIDVDNDAVDFSDFSLDEESPVESVSTAYKPVGENILKNISPAKWESLISILELLTKDSDDSVIIQDSVILHSVHGSILKADLNKAFDNDKITLHISSPKKWVRLFKQFKGDSVFIIDDNERNCFVVTNGEIRLFLPKQLAANSITLSIPNIEETKVVSKFNIVKETRDKILNLGKGSEYLEYLIQDNEVKCMNIPNTAIYIFSNYINDEKIKKITANNADLTLRTGVFLPIPAEEYSVLIGRKDDSSYYSYTTCKSGFLDIEIYESLDDASGANIFI